MPNEKDTKETSGFEHEVPTASSTHPMIAGQDGGGVPRPIEDEALTVPVHFDMPSAISGLVKDGRQSIPAVGSLEALSDVFSGLTPEKLAPGYEKMIGALRNFGILDVGGATKEGDAHLPTFEQAMASLSPEDFKFASTFKKPTLLLVPNTSFNSKIRAIRGKASTGGIQGLEDIKVHPLLHSFGEQGPEKITRWNISIVEGASTADFQLYADLVTHLQYRNEQKDPIDAGMNLQKYLMLLMVTSNNGGIDREEMTLIERDILLRSDQVVQAFCMNGTLYLNIARAGESVLLQVPLHSHFRSSVDGKLTEGK
jgi:hypothetical protein